MLESANLEERTESSHIKLRRKHIASVPLSWAYFLQLYTGLGERGTASWPYEIAPPSEALISRDPMGLSGKLLISGPLP